jgi:hypothetical protein
LDRGEAATPARIPSGAIVRSATCPGSTHAGDANSGRAVGRRGRRSRRAADQFVSGFSATR